jgi:hypothetical protein
MTLEPTDAEAFERWRIRCRLGGALARAHGYLVCALGGRRLGRLAWVDGDDPHDEVSARVVVKPLGWRGLLARGLVEVGLDDVLEVDHRRRRVVVRDPSTGGDRG